MHEERAARRSAHAPDVGGSTDAHLPSEYAPIRVGPVTKPGVRSPSSIARSQRGTTQKGMRRARQSCVRS